MGRAFAFPYATAQSCLSVELRISPGDLEPDDHRTIDAVELDEVDIGFDFEVDLGALGKVLPPGTDPEKSCSVGVRVQSESSRMRWVKCAPGVGGEQTVSVVLDRALCYGKIRLTPMVVLDGDLEEVAGLASAGGSILAEVEDYSVLMDPPQVLPGSSLRIEWRKFSEEPGVSSTDLFALRVEGTPIILLNTEFPNAYDILESRGTHGANARIRDVQFHLIVHQVWTSLIARALDSLSTALREGDRAPLEALEELEEWERQVVKDWAPHLTDSAGDEAIESLCKHVGKGTGDLLLVGVPSAIQSRFNTPASFSGLVKDLGKGASRD